MSLKIGDLVTFDVAAGVVWGIPEERTGILLKDGKVFDLNATRNIYDSHEYTNIRKFIGDDYDFHERKCVKLVNKFYPEQNISFYVKLKKFLEKYSEIAKETPNDHELFTNAELQKMAFELYDLITDDVEISEEMLRLIQVYTGSIKVPAGVKDPLQGFLEKKISVKTSDTAICYKCKKYKCICKNEFTGSVYDPQFKTKSKKIKSKSKKIKSKSKKIKSKKSVLKKRV